MKKVMLSKTKELAEKQNIALMNGTGTTSIATNTNTPTQILPERFNKQHQLQSAVINGIGINGGTGTPISPEYEQRRALKPAYTELFKVLFRIPDKQMQERVLDAINGITSGSGECPQCHKRVIKNLKREYKDSATQTEIIQLAVNDDDKCANALSDESRDTPPILGKDETNTTNSDENPPPRKKRKRKNCLPRVIKQSHAQHVQKEQQPLRRRVHDDDLVRIGKTNSSTTSVGTIKQPIAVKRERCDSITSTIINDIDSDNSISGICELVEPSKQIEITQDNIITTMAKEFVESKTCTNGYLPIHAAIIGNEFNRLRRQIYVWKKIKGDLNEIFTEDDEDCLQVAINHNSLAHTIEIILDAGFDVNCIYEASNSALHLAILNEIDVRSIVNIAKKIELSLLLKTNDNGYTPLYLAVRENRYIYAEAILKVIDERLNFKPYIRPEIVKESEESDKEEKAFAKFYAQQCEKIQLDIAKQLKKDKSEKFKFKQSLLNVNDPKSGSTMLFYAIEQQMEHFIYFLLAHLADPLIANLSGQDAKSYFGEYGRSLRLNVKIDKFLENVVAALQ